MLWRCRFLLEGLSLILCCQRIASLRPFSFKFVN